MPRERFIHGDERTTRPTLAGFANADTLAQETNGRTVKKGLHNLRHVALLVVVCYRRGRRGSRGDLVGLGTRGQFECHGTGLMKAFQIREEVSDFQVVVI